MTEIQMRGGLKSSHAPASRVADEKKGPGRQRETVHVFVFFFALSFERVALLRTRLLVSSPHDPSTIGLLGGAGIGLVR